MNKLKDIKKCYSCRKETHKDKIFCKDCEGKSIKTSPTLVIYDKI